LHHLYGSHVFPLQVVVLLSDERDFEGGQLVFTEQRPRMQSRVQVVARKPDTVWYSLSMSARGTVPAAFIESSSGMVSAASCLVSA